MNAILNWKNKLVTFQRNGYGAFGERKRARSPERDVVAEARAAAQELQRLKDEHEQQRRNAIQ